MSVAAEPELAAVACKGRVLLVEDDRDIRGALREFLEGSGFAVDEAADGFEGIERFRTLRHDIVVSDIQMPRMKGIDLLRRIRQIEPEASVVLVTGHPSMDVAIEGMKEGACDFIIKPFSLKKVLFIVTRLMEEKRLKAENRELSQKLKEGEATARVHENARRRLGEISRLALLAQPGREDDGLKGLEERVLRTAGEALEAEAAALAVAHEGGYSVLSLGLESPTWVRTQKLERDADPMVAALEAVSSPDGQAGLLACPIANGSRVVGALALARRSRAFSDGERQILESLCGDAAVALENAQLFRDMHEEFSRTEQELKLASRIQQGLLPARPPQMPRLRIRTLTRGARRVSGDFLGFTRGFDGCLGVFVGDVAGKGMPAALLMAMATHVFRELGKRRHAPEDVLAEANSTLADYLGRGVTYVTAIHALINPRRHEMVFAQAGHERPLVYRAATGAVEMLEATGTVLGMFPRARFEPRKARLDKGDVLVLITDGVVDATDRSGCQFGHERLKATIALNGSGGAPAVMAAIEGEIDRFVGGSPPRDDITLVAVEMGYEGWEEVVSTGARDAANSAKAVLYDYVEGLGLERAAFDDVKFVIKEAVQNAIEHGHRGDARKTFKLAWRADEDQLVIRVIDSGPGFCPADLPNPTAAANAFKPRGRGVFLMRRMMDEVSFNAAGNEIELVKSLTP